MNIENKSTEEQPNSSPLELFLAKIANQTKDPETRRIIKRDAEEHLAETKTPITDQCLFAHEIGANFFEVKAYDAAAECFQFAFLNEDPYNTNISIYAMSFINATNNYWQILPEGLKTEAKEWMEDKKSSIKPAINCIEHFRYFTIYKEGYDQVPKDKDGDLRWDINNYNKVIKYSEFETIGENLLTQ